MVSKNSRIIEDVLKFCIGLMIMVIINQLAGHFPLRWDLTEEKRFSIQPATKALLKSLNSVVYVDVYLEGQLPSGFARLQKSIQETLDEFRMYAGDNLRYRFVDPDQATSATSRNQFYAKLAEKGIQPSNVIDTKEGQRTEKLVFPGAIVAMGTQEMGVLLLKGNKGSGPDEQLNQSIEGLEYELASAIRGLSSPDRQRIGLVMGHGELGDQDITDLTTTLSSHYNLGKVNLSIYQDLIGYDALLVLKPILQYSEIEKYVNYFNIPPHPMVGKGYESIGCTHCTAKGQGRNGRWSGKSKTECGLHINHFPGNIKKKEKVQI